MLVVGMCAAGIEARTARQLQYYTTYQACRCNGLAFRQCPGQIPQSQYVRAKKKNDKEVRKIEAKVYVNLTYTLSK